MSNDSIQSNSHPFIITDDSAAPSLPVGTRIRCLVDQEVSPGDLVLMFEGAGYRPRVRRFTEPQDTILMHRVVDAIIPIGELDAAARDRLEAVRATQRANFTAARNAEDFGTPFGRRQREADNLTCGFALPAK